MFDEFSFGNKSPQAMKDFLQYAATSWKIKPRYVLLVGDASYDPKNYLGLGDSDLVPTRLIDTSLMETASDDWLAALQRRWHCRSGGWTAGSSNSGGSIGDGAKDHRL